jgi:hypothetical protein
MDDENTGGLRVGDIREWQWDSRPGRGYWIVRAHYTRCRHCGELYKKNERHSCPELKCYGESL